MASPWSLRNHSPVPAHSLLSPVCSPCVVPQLIVLFVLISQERCESSSVLLCSNAALSALLNLCGYTGNWSALALSSFWVLSCPHYPLAFACQFGPSSSLDCGFSFHSLIVPSLRLSLSGYPASLQRYFGPNCSDYIFPQSSSHVFPDKNNI